MGMHTGTGDNFLIEENIFLLNAKCLLLTKRNLQIILVQSMDTLSIANRSLFLLFTALVFSVINTITEAGHQILLFEWILSNSSNIEMHKGPQGVCQKIRMLDDGPEAAPRWEFAPAIPVA